MSLSSKDVALSGTRQLSHVRDLLDTDPQDELFFETPPPDVVNSINECFEQFTNTSEKRKDASLHKPSSDSDSGESLFITQSVTKAIQTKRRLKEFSTDDSGDGGEWATRRLSEDQDTEIEDASEASCPKRRKNDLHVPSKKATFPFLLKSFRRQHLPMEKHQILENSEIGGFFKCIKKIEESYEGIIITGKAISPRSLESELSDEGEHNSDHEVTIVDRDLFVPRYNKEQRQKWLPDSILKSRNQDPLDKKKTKSIKTNASVKKQSQKKTQVPKRKAGARTLSRSSCISHEVLASCSDSEHSDSGHCVKNSHKDHLVVIEETQRNTAEEDTEAADHVEDEMSSRTDHDQPNHSNLTLPPQGGDVSLQNDTQEHDSDSNSLDLFSPLNSPKQNSQIHETTSITANMEDSDQDSDVTQIDTQGMIMSTFGPGTKRWCDAESYSAEENNSNTQIETEEESVSLLETRTPNKQFRTAVQSPEHTGLFSRKEEKIKHKNRETVSRSPTEVGGIEKTVNIMNCELSSKDLAPANKPFREKSRQEVTGEMEIDTQDSPLFRNIELSFLKRKKKTAATEFIQSDSNVHNVQNSVSDSQADVVTGLKTTHRESIESCEVQNRLINEEQTEISALVDSGEITKVKRKKKKKDKSKQDVEPCLESELVEAQMTELTTKRGKKKKKDKERADIPSNEAFDCNKQIELRVNESSETSETDRCKHDQTLEEITECPSLNVAELKLAKKKKKKKRHETDKPQDEAIDLDVNSASPFDAGFSVVKQQEQQVIVERQINDNVNEQLDGEPMCVEKVSKHKKKSQNTSSLADDMTGLKEQRSESQSGNIPETSHLGSEDMVSTMDKWKKKKKQKLKGQNEIDCSSEIDNNEQLYENNELQTADLMSRRTKKKKANKNKERIERLEQIDDRPSEKRGNNAIQLEHLHTSEEPTRCPTPSVATLSSGPKKKKKKKRSEKNQHELNQDLSSVSNFYSATGLKARQKDQVIPQTITEERQNDDNVMEHLEGNEMHTLKAGKRKKKYQIISDDIIGLNSIMSELQPRSTVELEEKINSSSLSDSVYSSKLKKKKKKKQKIKELDDAEPVAYVYNVDSVHLVESDQCNESQTTELTPKKTKKRKKDKERAKSAYVDEHFEAPQADHPGQIKEVTQCSSPNMSTLKSTKKKKRRKRDETEKPQCESVDLDASSVSQFDDVTERSSIQEAVEESPSDVAEHTKHKKRRKQSSFSVNGDFNSPAVQLEETVTPERRKKKKKRNSDCITDTGDELTLESPDCTTLFNMSQSLILKSPDGITKRKTNKEINESKSYLLENTADPDAIQTRKSASAIQSNNADGPVSGSSSLIDSEVSACIKKKTKKRKMDAENNINDSNAGGKGDGTPNRTNKRQRGDASDFIQSHRTCDAYDENNQTDGHEVREPSASQNEEVSLHKKKKKRKKEELDC